MACLSAKYQYSPASPRAFGSGCKRMGYCLLDNFLSLSNLSTPGFGLSFFFSAIHLTLLTYILAASNIILGVLSWLKICRNIVVILSWRGFILIKVYFQMEIIQSDVSELHAHLHVLCNLLGVGTFAATLTRFFQFGYVQPVWKSHCIHSISFATFAQVYHHKEKQGQC